MLAAGILLTPLSAESLAEAAESGGVHFWTEPAGTWQVVADAGLVGNSAIKPPLHSSGSHSVNWGIQGPGQVRFYVYEPNFPDINLWTHSDWMRFDDAHVTVLENQWRQYDIEIPNDYCTLTLSVISGAANTLVDGFTYVPFDVSQDLASACDLPSLQWSTPKAAWYVLFDEKVRGGSYLTSGPVYRSFTGTADRGKLGSQATAAVSGPALIRYKQRNTVYFWGESYVLVHHKDMEINPDLLWPADGSEVEPNDEWVDASWFIPAGDHLMTFRASGGNTYDSGGTFDLDDFSIETLEARTLPDAVDNTELQFTQEADRFGLLWSGLVDPSAHDGDSLRVHSSETSGFLETTLTGPGVLEFSWKKLLAGGIGVQEPYLSIRQNDIHSSNWEISGLRLVEVGVWELEKIYLPQGSVTVRWYAGGNDTSIDYIRYMPQSGNVYGEALGCPELQFTHTPENLPWSVQSERTPDGTTALLSPSNAFAVSNLSTIIQGPGTLRFAIQGGYRIVWDDFWYRQFFSMTPLDAGQRPVEAQRAAGRVPYRLSSDWHSYEVPIPDGPHRCSWDVYNRDFDAPYGDGHRTAVGQVRYTPAQSLTMAQALEAPYTRWNVSGLEGWTGVQRLQPINGDASTVRSPLLSPNEECILWTTVSGPGIYRVMLHAPLPVSYEVVSRPSGQAEAAWSVDDSGTFGNFPAVGSPDAMTVETSALIPDGRYDIGVRVRPGSTETPISMVEIDRFSVQFLGMWAGTEPAGDGWYYIPSIGYLCRSLNSNWHYSLNHGWVYIPTQIKAVTEGCWFFESGLGWVWTSKMVSPYLYSSQRKAWLRYLDGTRAPRWFYSNKDRAWISVP